MVLVSTAKGIASNRLAWVAMVGTLVWLAAQPTVDGYHPLLEMFWKTQVSARYLPGTALCFCSRGC